jgi:AcrR family transcriptional regulator
MALIIDAAPIALDGRILDATLDCLSRWGVAKTTLDDVARQATCSRATVYRVFPGGKEALLQAVARREIDRACAAVVAEVESATCLEDALTNAMVATARHISGHQPLQFLLTHEPETVVPWLAFQRGEETLAVATAALFPHLLRWLPADEARQAGEWAARLVLSFCFCPSPVVDLTDPDGVRWLVTTFMLGGLQ